MHQIKFRGIVVQLTAHWPESNRGTVSTTELLQGIGSARQSVTAAVPESSRGTVHGVTWTNTKNKIID